MSIRPFVRWVPMAIAVSGCGQSFPSGENLYSSGSPALILNNQQGQWRLLVDGVVQDNVSVVSSDLIIAREGTTHELQINGVPAQGVPITFSLRQAYRGSLTATDYICTSCPGSRREWKLIRRD